MGSSWRHGRPARTPGEVWAEWQAADAADDAGRASELATEMTRVAAADFTAWFEAGLFSKARRDWVECAARNDRALALFTDDDAQAYDGLSPAAWNLGIAATALGDWRRPAGRGGPTASTPSIPARTRSTRIGAWSRSD